MPLNSSSRRRSAHNQCSSSFAELLESRTLLSGMTKAALVQNVGYSNEADHLISSTGPTKVTSDIVVSGLTGQISDVNVSVEIDHTADRDLTLTLISPDGTRITLAEQVGGARNDFTGTVFDDEANTHVSDGRAPFNGSFRPQQSLSSVDGSDPNGVWTLEVSDTRNRNGGVLHSWSLQLTIADSPSPPPPSGGSTGTVTLNRTQYNVGENVAVTVSDSDLSGLSQVHVNLTSGTDVETVTLNATSPGVFQGSIGTSAASGADQNGTLNVVSGNSIVATYADTSDANRNPSTASTSATLTSHTASISFAKSAYVVGDTLSITLSDVDLTGLSSVVTTVNFGGDQESVVLTALGSGTFRGTIGTTGSAGSNNNGSLNVTSSGAAYASYTDSVNATGSAQSVEAMTSIDVAAPQPTSQFQIVVRFIDNSLTPSQKAIFNEAAARWSEIITGDLPDVYTSIGLVDDLVIDASAPYIDGNGGILGSAGPREVRSGSLLPAYGVMQFDSADMANMEANGSLVNVIIHEMGHCIGIGTLWSSLGVLSGGGTSNPVFTGVNARAAYGELLGTGPTNVPVANTGGSGTRDAHWRESVFANELMTGYLNGGSNPISSVTVASLIDIGYVVNSAAADLYTLSGTSLFADSTKVNGRASLVDLENPSETEIDDLDHDHAHFAIPEFIVLSRRAEVVSTLSKLSSLGHGFDSDWFEQFLVG